MTKQSIGRKAETRVRYLLERYGRKVSERTYNAPFDLLVDGKRVEVKAAEPRPDQQHGLKWCFNIHRHGIVSELTDYYILRLQSVPFTKASIHLLLKAPLNVSTIAISVRALLNQQYAKEVADFYEFARGLTKEQAA